LEAEESKPESRSLNVWWGKGTWIDAERLEKRGGKVQEDGVSLEKVYVSDTCIEVKREVNLRWRRWKLREFAALALCFFVRYVVRSFAEWWCELNKIVPFLSEISRDTFL
jgi:hypothetical protein